MTPSEDPFDARPTAELLATDALLDRVGARAPTPDDLDDPVIAALALMAAEIDLGPVPVEETRAGLARAVPELAAPPAPDAPGQDQSTGLVIDLRDSAARRPPERKDVRRPQRSPRQPERAGPPVAMAPPRSLPRMPAPGGGPAGTRAPRGRRQRTMRPMVAVAVAATAIVLGSGVSAALTGGRSVNPLDGIQQVVAGLTHGRTQDQLKAYEDVKRYLDAAQKYADNKQYASARGELNKIGTPLLRRLTDDDRTWANARVDELNKVVPR
jgi:hypothetical protein